MKAGLFASLLGLGACLASSHAAAKEPSRWSIGVETGAVWQAKNDVQIPGDTGTRFALDDVTGDGPFPFLRLEATYRLTDKQELRGLIAPLSISEDGTLASAVNFNGQTFAPGAASAKYQFNSYRLTWRYTVLESPQWTWKLGVTAKVRDATIELRQGGVQSSDSNTGLVPLFNAYGEYRFADRWRAIFDFDGLVGPNGRAFDIGLKVGYDLTRNLSLEGGYRMLEGGVDNDDVYNFARFNYAVVGVRYRF
jgi:opacity protein-like surface antigen